MKNKLFILFSLPFLVSCNTYRGALYELPYDENASLKEITPKEVFNIGAISKSDSVFLVAGLDGCQSCVNAKEDTYKYINKYHVSIYYVDINKVTFSNEYPSLDQEYPNTDYFYLYYATTYINQGVIDINSLPHPDNIKELSLPSVLFFKYGGVGANIHQDVYSYLYKYIKVIK